MSPTPPEPLVARSEVALQLASWLQQQHRDGQAFQPFSHRASDASLASAYAVQQAFVRLQACARGADVAGWKIGLTSATMQALCRIATPVAGVVLDDVVHRSGASLRRDRYGRCGVEFEIAVRMGCDVVPGPRPFTADDLAVAVEAVAPAMEIVDDRGCDYTTLDVFSLVADNAWNAGIVLGPWRRAWPDLAEVTGVVSVDGQEVDRGRGSDVLGHPFNPLAWLANHLAERGDFLRAGQIVMTGSLVRTRFPDIPQRIQYQAQGLGLVELDLG